MCLATKAHRALHWTPLVNASRDGQPRRYFSCQFSKAAGSEASCRRASCSRYIQLAYEQLKPTEFADIVKRVQARFEEGSEYHQALATYLTGKPSDAFFKQFCVPRTQPTPGSSSSDESQVTLTDHMPVATKRKAESPSVEHLQDRSCKRVCAGQVTDRKALVRAEIASMVDDFSVILKTRLTAICDILHPAEIDIPHLPSPLTLSIRPTLLVLSLRQARCLRSRWPEKKRR